MLKQNPLYHAVAAVAYIGLIVLGIGSFPGPDPETLLLPMAMLSLFVLSAAIMGYLFLGVPLMMYLDGQKKEAVSFFSKTVGYFAIFVAVFFAILVLVIR